MGKDMEDRFGRLLEAASNRIKLAKELKGQGKKIIGLLCPYIPEEIIYAAGMVPWRIIGTWRENTPRALGYMPTVTDAYCLHALESFLVDEFDFLDGIIGTNWNDDRRALYDVLTHTKRHDFAMCLHVPHTNRESSYRYFASELIDMKKGLEHLGGAEISESALLQAIEVYNKMRTLLKTIYNLRKQDIPSISGSEAVRITTAAFVMLKDEYIQELEALQEYLRKRQISNHVRPRVLVSSDSLAHPGYLELIENAGSLIAMDDLDTGSRYFWNTMVDTATEPLYSLAKYYIARTPCPRMFFWNTRQIEEWVKAFNIDGVLNLQLRYCVPRDFLSSFLINRHLDETGIPNITITTDYYFANVGQFRTRVEAFLETLRARLVKGG